MNLSEFQTLTHPILELDSLDEMVLPFNKMEANIGIDLDALFESSLNELIDEPLTNQNNISSNSSLKTNMPPSVELECIKPVLICKENTELDKIGNNDLSEMNIDFNLLDELLSIENDIPVAENKGEYKLYNVESSANSSSDEMNSTNSYEFSAHSNSFMDSINDDASLSSITDSDESPNYSSEEIPKTKSIRRTHKGRVDKKESNKAAAVRYRNKKLKEREQLFAECEAYSKKNEELRSKIDDVQTKISFIKSLLVEALIVKSGSKE